MSSAPSQLTGEALRSLSVEEFNACRQSLVCCVCGHTGNLQAHLVSTNGGLRVDCTDCGKQHALGRVLFLKQTTKKTRKEYGPDDSLDDVWERFDNVCVVCGAPKWFLDREGIKRDRHHILEYVVHQHAGQLVPMCGPCHTNTTERQKLFWFWFRRSGISE